MIDYIKIFLGGNIMAMEITNKKVDEVNGLLSKIQIGGKVYELKDLIARNSIEELAGIIDALKYVASTGIYADDAAIKAAIEAGDTSMKNYVDAQVGAINKFDVAVVDTLPDASADTMYILYLVKKAGSTGDFVEYITVRSGEEGAYTYTMEQIGSTAMDLTGFVTEDALADAIDPINERLAELGDLANKDEADLNLKALAHKDSATGTVAGQTISGVKAAGTTTGSITVELEATEKNVASAGKFTPVGAVSGTVQTAGSIAVTAKYDSAEATLSKGDYTPAGTVSANFGHTTTAATLEMSKHAPEGSVTVALSGNTFNAITGVGTQASYNEGTFTPAALKYDPVEKTVAKEGMVASIPESDPECLVLSAAAMEAISASKVTSFSGGSKEADTFVPNSLPTMAQQNVGVQSATFTGVEHECVTGVKYDKASLSDLAFAGTKAEGALVTGVSYQKAGIGSATFTGETVDIAASFTGTEGDVSVTGKCHDYDVKTAQFNGADIELAVGDISVSAKEVTVQ
jgi:hypothetical protein